MITSSPKTMRIEESWLRLENTNINRLNIKFAEMEMYVKYKKMTHKITAPLVATFLFF